jgi:alkylation response protein AidB-like acyl-CoA dehydrogenase
VKHELNNRMWDSAIQTALSYKGSRWKKRNMQSGRYDAYVERVLAVRQPKFEKYAGMLAEFSRWVLTEVDAQAAYTDRYAPPALETYGKDGTVVNRIVLNPRYEAQHEEIYRRGIVGLPYSEGAPHLLSFAMGYLLAEADISLHCPATLTGAVAYVLGYHAPENVRNIYLPELVRMDGLAKTGGTWATEKHGGSDVGATTTVAIRNGERFALHGLKWFTSNANSGLALATARPQGAASGSEGLGLYLVASHREGGAPNNYRIRRLKDKLGTKGLPTGEIELEGAEAIEVAAPPYGLKVMMEALEYSRIHNAVGAAGIQRRALLEALQWAKSRKAFGRALIEYPMVREQLLALRVRFEASTLLSFEAALTFDAALQDSERRSWLRVVTALAKYLSAEDAIQAARAWLELLGGNGYTSDYAAERILRDAQVLTVWEGPANIQALELLRMLGARYGGEAEYERRMQNILERLPETVSALRPMLAARLAEDMNEIRFVTGDKELAARYARKLLHRLSQSLAFGLMCEMAASGDRCCFLTAWRYFEEIEPPKLGLDNRNVSDAALEILDDEISATPDARRPVSAVI